MKLIYLIISSLLCGALFSFVIVTKHGIKEDNNNMVRFITYGLGIAVIVFVIFGLIMGIEV